MQGKKKRTTSKSPERPTRSTIGSGITKRGVVSIPFENPSPEATAALKEAFARIGKISTFDGRIRFAEEWSRKVLAEEKPGSERKPYETLAWYAARFLDEAELVRKIAARVKTDPEAARKETDALMRFSFELGILAYEIGVKIAYERDTLLGIKDRRTRKRGGDSRGKQISEEAGPREDAVLRENERLLPRRLTEHSRSRIIAGNLNLPTETVRSILRRSK